MERETKIHTLQTEVDNAATTLADAIMAPPPTADYLPLIYSASEMSESISRIVESEGVREGRKLASNSLKKIYNALQDDSTTEEGLAQVNRYYLVDGEGHAVTHTIATAVRELGYYQDTINLVIEAARHTGLPIADLTQMVQDLYESDKEFMGDRSNREAAVALLDDIAETQFYLPDSYEKATRVAEVSKTAINMMVANEHLPRPSMTTYQRLVYVVNTMCRSIEDPRLITLARRQLENAIGVRDIEETLSVLKFGLQSFDGFPIK